LLSSKVNRKQDIEEREKDYLLYGGYSHLLKSLDQRKIATAHGTLNPDFHSKALHSPTSDTLLKLK